MKVAFEAKKITSVAASMACSCRCKNVYSSAPGMRVPHR